MTYNKKSTMTIQALCICTLTITFEATFHLKRQNQLRLPN